MKTLVGRRLYVVRVTGLLAIIVAVTLAASAQTTANKGQSAEKTTQPAPKPAQSPQSTDQNVAATQQQAIANPLTISSADQYRIGSGDVLNIHILNRPNLSRDAVRVEGNGMIRMPLIDTDIQAGCLTEGELAKEIAGRYTKYYKNPQVDVFIKEYHSKQVAIIGAVNDQSRFELQRRVRLLELLTYAKGPSPKAGQTINIVHSPPTLACEKRAGSEEVASSLSRYKLSETIPGVTQTT